MKKLNGYEDTYYPERWEHKGWEICKLTDHSYLIFDHAGEKVIKCCATLESAQRYIDLEL
jgi:hypothetical protein